MAKTANMTNAVDSAYTATSAFTPILMDAANTASYVYTANIVNVVKIYKYVYKRIYTM